MRIALLCFVVVAGCNGRTIAPNDPGGTAKDGGTDGSTKPAVCGGLHGTPCKSDEWCDYPDSAACGMTDETGVCRKRPQACDNLFQPVCGCDGSSYDNACFAESGGTDVAYEGVCNAPPPPAGDCGGFAGTQCPADQYCKFPSTDLCGGADSSGTCTPRPQACNDLEQPVCGCDQMTYSNACTANAAGVDILHDGACDMPADCRTTGCPQGQTCQLCWTSYACLDPDVAC